MATAKLSAAWGGPSLYDEAGDVDEAIRLYSESLVLIRQGLEGNQGADTSVLQHYAQVYTDRVAVLRRGGHHRQPRRRRARQRVP